MGLGIKDNCKRTGIRRKNIMMGFEYPWEILQEECSWAQGREHGSEIVGICIKLPFPVIFG